MLILVTRIWLGRWREPMTLLVCVAGEVAILLSVAALVERPRPDVPHLDPAPPTSSYPSGHTAAAVALYGCMAIVVLRQLHPRWMARVVAGLLIVVPVLVGFSRLYRGMHHPTDVVVGALGISTWVWIVVATLLVHPPSGRTDQHPVDVAQRSRPETLPHSGAS